MKYEILMMVNSAIEKASIENNLKQFLVVLLVSLTVATLPQIFSWFRHIPLYLIIGNCRISFGVC
jgi:monovalent cation:H+ antiporter, CPA1 family